VAFGAEDVQAAQLAHAFTEHDVGAATGHVGGDGHVTALTGQSNDLRFLLVVFGVEHAVRHAGLLEHGGEQFGGLDGDGAHQHRLPRLVQFGDGLRYGVVLLALGPVDGVGEVLALHGLVGGNGDHLERVYLMELHRLGVGGTRHAREFGVHAEVVLEGDARQRLVLGFDLHRFLGFKGLMEAVAETASGHEAAGELVDDDHLSFLDDVVHVAAEEVVRLERLHQVVLGGDVAGVVEVVDAHKLFAEGHAFVGEHGRSRLLVHCEVGVARELADDFVHMAVQPGGFFRRTGDDERGSRFVDEDGVHFVDDGEVVTALHQLFGIELHVVAQVVEAEFIVGTVGYVGTIGGLALFVVETMHDDTNGKAEEVVQLPHPCGVALGEVVVDGDDVHALAGERIEHHGQRGDQRLAFTGLHLGNLAVMQRHAAHKLDVEVAHVEHALARLTDECEHFGQHVVEFAPFFHLLAVFGDADGEILVAEGLHLRFEGVDGGDDGAKAFDVAVVLGTEDLLEEETEHVFSRRVAVWRARGRGGHAGCRTRLK